MILSNEREISVRYHLCEAPEGPVPGKWYRTLISRSILSIFRLHRFRVIDADAFRDA